MKERKRKRREQRTKESIKSILFKRRFTHLTNGDTKRLQRRWNSISLTRHPLKFHPDQRDHIFESIYIPLRSVNKYLCGYLYIYIPGVDKILTRSPRDAAEFHYANSRREPPRKESWNNLHLGILATTRPRARNRPSPRPTWRGNPLGDNNTGGKIESV